MEHNQKLQNAIYLLAAGGTTFLLYYLLLPEQQKQLEKMTSSVNMGVFLVSFFFFCAVCFVLCIVKNKIHTLLTRKQIGQTNTTKVSNTKFWFILIWIVFILCFWRFISIMMQNEPMILGSPAATTLWQTETLFSFCFIAAASFALFIALAKPSSFAQDENTTDRWYVCFAQCSIICIYAHASFFSNYMFNPAVAHHGNAYFNSIYNVMNGTPYTDISNSMYGCYALLMAPILKIIGASMKNFGYLMSGIGVIYMLCIAYSMNVLLKKNSMKILGLLAAGTSVIGFRADPYYQAQPHRVLFSGIMLAYAVFVFEKEKNRICFQIGGFIIAAIAIVWNKETGIICVLSWTALQIYSFLRQSGKKDIRFWIKLFVPCIEAIFSLLLSVSIVGIYNLMTAGIWIEWDAFWFPLFNNKYMVDALQVSLYNSLNMDIVIYLTFLYPVAKAIYTFNAVGTVKQDYLFFFCALMGIGLFTYYVNRPAYFNMDIVHGFFFILVCGYLEKNLMNYIKGKGNYKVSNAMNGILSFVGIFLILAFSVMGVLHFQVTDRNRAVYRFSNELDQLTLEIKEKIPENTVAYGNGIAEIYTELGWDSEIYILDASDIEMNPDSKNYLIQYLNQLDEPILFAENTVDPQLWRPEFQTFLDTFHLADTITYNEIDYLYYVPIH